MDDDGLDRAAGAAFATAMVCESLIELLVMRGVLPGEDVIEALDTSLWAVEEQPLGPGFSAATKAAQRAALQFLLERLRSHPGFS